MELYVNFYLEESFDEVKTIFNENKNSLENIIFLDCYNEKIASSHNLLNQAFDDRKYITFKFVVDNLNLSPFDNFCNYFRQKNIINIRSNIDCSMKNKTGEIYNTFLNEKIKSSDDCAEHVLIFENTLSVWNESTLTLLSRGYSFSLIRNSSDIIKIKAIKKVFNQTKKLSEILQEFLEDRNLLTSLDYEYNEFYSCCNFYQKFLYAIEENTNPILDDKKWVYDDYSTRETNLIHIYPLLKPNF
jgi:hypothetical protein